MADLVPTQCVPLAGARLKRVTAAVAVAVADVLYRDPTSTYAGGVNKADANAGDPAKGRVFGLAPVAAAAGVPFACVVEGDVDLGVAVARGVWYGTSINPGKIAPVADQASGQYASLVGYGKGGNVLHVVRAVNSEQLI